MEKQTIGKFMQSLRKAKGYSQQSVAEMLGVSNKTISSWECDNTAPDLYMLPAIAELYEVTIDELVNGHKANAEITNNTLDKTYDALLKNMLIAFNNKFVVVLILLLLSLIIPGIGNSLLLIDDSRPMFIADIIMSSIGVILLIIGIILGHYNLSVFFIKTDVPDEKKYKYWDKALKTNMKLFLIILGIIVLTSLILLVFSFTRGLCLLFGGIFTLLFIAYLIIIKLYIYDYNKRLGITKKPRRLNLFLSLLLSAVVMILLIKGQGFMKYHPMVVHDNNSSIFLTMEKPKNLSKLSNKNEEYNLDDYSLIKTIDSGGNQYKAYVKTSDLDFTYVSIDTLIYKNDEYIGQTKSYLKVKTIYYPEEIYYDVIFVHLNMNWEYYDYAKYFINLELININERRNKEVLRTTTIVVVCALDAAFVAFSIIYYKKRKNN